MPFNFSKFSPSLAVSREGLLPPGVHDLTRAGDKSVFLEGTSHTRHNTTTKKNKSSEGKIKKNNVVSIPPQDILSADSREMRTEKAS